jgi:hypothetical protein
MQKPQIWVSAPSVNRPKMPPIFLVGVFWLPKWVWIPGESVLCTKEISKKSPKSPRNCHVVNDEYARHSVHEELSPSSLTVEYSVGEEPTVSYKLSLLIKVQMGTDSH